MKVVCTKIWDKKIINKDGNEVTVHKIKLCRDSDGYEYPFWFTSPLNFFAKLYSRYEASFAFSYGLRNVDKVNPVTGEVSTVKEQFPVLTIENISLLKG